MSQSTVTEVRSVLIPLAANRLLLPNAVVAEVLDFQTPEAEEGKPEWYLGKLTWRGISIPVVSFEALLGGEVMTPGHRGRIVVTNTLNGEKSLTHIGMLSQTIPSLVRVTAENVEPVEMTGTQGGLVKQSVNINDGLALIPDLDELERRVLELIRRH